MAFSNLVDKARTNGEVLIDEIHLEGHCKEYKSYQSLLVSNMDTLNSQLGQDQPGTHSQASGPHVLFDPTHVWAREDSDC